MRTTIAMSVVLLCTCAAWGQEGHAPPVRQPLTMPGSRTAAPPSAKPELKDEAKLRYIRDSLSLNAKQREHVDALIATYASEKKAQEDGLKGNIEMIRSMAAELEEANKNNDTEKANQIRERLMKMSSPAHLEDEFFENLAEILDEPQKAQLKEVRERLARNPSGELRPVDVLRLARSFDLSPEQHQKLQKVTAVFRETVKAAPNFANQKGQLLSEFIISVRDVLTDEQGMAFDRQVAALRGSDASAPEQPAEQGGG